MLRAIVEAYDNGIRNFISGFATGIDLMTAQTILSLKLYHSGMVLTAAIPFNNNMKKEITLGDNYHANVGKCCYGHVQGHDYYYGYNFSSRIEKHFKTLEEAKAWAEEENNTLTKIENIFNKKKTKSN